MNDKQMVAAMPQDWRSHADQFLAAGLDIQTVIAVLIQHGPELIRLGKDAAELIARIVADLRRPAAPAADRCPEHIAKQRQAILCALCCNYAMERDHNPPAPPA